MLWSPSCSASLSERFAPLKAKRRRRQEVWRVVYQRQNSEIYMWKKKKKTLTSSGAHWCPQTCSCWGTSPASASWRHDSFRQERPSGCCRWGNQMIKMINLCSQGESQCGVSAFGAHQCVYLEQTSLNSQVWECNHLSPTTYTSVFIFFIYEVVFAWIYIHGWTMSFILCYIL